MDAYEDDSDTNYKWCILNSPKRLGKKTGRIGNKKKYRDYRDHSIVKNG